MTRRKFLKISLALLALPFIPNPLGANDDIETYSLHIKRNNVTENITFIENGLVIEDEYLRLCHIFKDIKADVAVKMDIELLKILSRGQQWIVNYGYSDPLVITSAYRTFDTNNATEGAAYNSMHLYGMAVDLKYPGLPIKYLAVLFRSFGASGIGIYSTFLHIDTWRERVWIG